MIMRWSRYEYASHHEVMLRLFSFGLPDQVASRAVIRVKDGHPIDHLGRRLQPSVLSNLTLRGGLVVDDAAAYALVRARSSPLARRRLDVCASLAYNPLVTVVETEWNRVVGAAIPRPPTSEALAELTRSVHPNTVATSVQTMHMTAIRASARAIVDACAHELTTASAATLFKLSADVTSRWSSITALDLLARESLVSNGAVVMATVSPSSSTGHWVLDMSQPSKLRPGPVIASDAEGNLACLRLDSLGAHAGRLAGEFVVTGSRDIAPKEIGTRVLERVAHTKATLYLSDNTYSNSVFLDAVDAWSPEIARPALEALARRTVTS